MTLPPWVSQGGEAIFREAREFSKSNPAGRPAPFNLSAPIDRNQIMAARAARNKEGVADLDVARGLVAQGAAPFSAEALQPHMNPWLQAVQQATLSEMDRRAAMNQMDVNQAAQQAKAFGGDRHGVMAAEMARNDAQLRNQFLAQSNAEAFEAARRSLGEQQARQLQAAQQALATGMGAGDLQRQNIQNLTATGGIMQALRQDEIDRLYQDWLRQQSEPMQRYAQLAALLGVPTNRTSFTEQFGPKKSPFGQVLGAATALAPLVFSDPRLKPFAVRVGNVTRDVGAWIYRYAWETRLRLGVMADEVAIYAPWALGPTVMGFMTVRPGLLPSIDRWQFFAA